MIKAFLESIEDPNRPLLGPNYWLLKNIGLVIPKQLSKKILNMMFLVSAIYLVFTQYVELFVTRSDVDLVITNLQVSMLTTIVNIKKISFIIWQDNWRQVIEYVTDADKYERNNQTETKANIINSYTKYCRRATYSYWALVLITYIIFITRPLSKYCLSPDFREGFRNGSESFPHLVSTWMPFNKDKSPGLWITYFWHVLITGYGSIATAAYDSSAIAILVFFGGKFELLRTRCREMLGTNGVGVSDEQADRAVREIHNIHVLLLKYSRLFNSLLSNLMFVYMVMCTLLICTSAYQITSTANIMQKILIAEYLFFAIAQLFLFCWHSHDVIDKSSQVMLGPYESEWWAANLRQRRIVLILQAQMEIEHMYTAGPFINLTLPTFVSILKSAYSYYALLSNK